MEQGGAVVTPQEGTQGVDVSIPVMEEPIDEVLSIPGLKMIVLVFQTCKGLRKRRKRRRKRTRRRKGTTRRRTTMRKRMMRTKWRKTRTGHTQSRRWKRRCKTSQPRKEAILLMRWDISFLYFFFIPFCIMKCMMFIEMSFSALSLRP